MWPGLVKLDVYVCERQAGQVARWKLQQLATHALAQLTSSVLRLLDVKGRKESKQAGTRLATDGLDQMTFRP